MSQSIFRRTALRGALLAASALTVSSLAQAENLPLERLFASPSLSGAAPRAVQYSPDGSRVTYLKGKQTDANRLDLWEYNISANRHQLLVNSDDLVKGNEVLSDEEKARRERMRLFASGIISYSWSKDGSALLFPLNGDLYYYNLQQKQAKKLTNTDAFETDAKISPKGKYVSFVRDQDLFVIDIQTGQESQLTSDGEGNIKNGMSEFVAQEEMGRMTGYWWAPDDSKIAFLHVDESPVAQAVRNEIYADEIKLYNQRYPFTGTANAIVELGVVNVASKAVQWVKHGDNKDVYLPRVDWTQDSNVLTYQWQSRNQQALELRKVDLTSGAQQVLVKESSNTWLNLHDDLKFLKDGKRFIWASERDGFKHLYLYGLNGKMQKQLTKGDWVVDNIATIDEKNGWIYFVGRKDTPLETHLYKVSLKGGAITRISEPKYSHGIVMAKDGSGFIDSYSNVTTPTAVRLANIKGETLTLLEANAVTGDHPLTPYASDLVTPRFGTIKADDGQTMYYRIFEPKNLTGKHPVIVSVYGGPGAQRVRNTWSGRDLYFQYLVQKGYIIFQLDNRGSESRGKKFEDPIYQHLADVEIRDQIKGVEYLRSLPYVDPERIGIYGHSYGGYMTIMAMFKAGDYFKAGVSGAPVTDWKLYDTHYTERYLGHPAQNAEGYEQSAVFPYAAGLKGPLLIYHGMADDNVLFTHATKVYKQLQDLGKPFEMMNYPGSKHSMFGQSVQTHLHMTITDFFDKQFGMKP